MPLIEPSSYKKPPFYLFNPHLETIVPSAFRKVKLPSYERERIYTPDNDFLDLDWLRKGAKQLVVISHGLEGSSDRPYVKGMARVFREAGWDVLAWNCRTCSGEINKAPRMYHHAVSDDLDVVVKHAFQTKAYQKVALVGFSMGGSITLKYLGEYSNQLPAAISRAAVFSVPCDLGGSARELSKKGNNFYRKRFLRKLANKLKAKSAQMPELVNCEGVEKIQHFSEFDNRFTAPIHGFKDAEDFYRQASANTHLPDIRIPTLIVNAKNDPMLSAGCYPEGLAKELPHIYLEMPDYGGHVGFTLAGQPVNWAEQRALRFITENQ